MVVTRYINHGNNLIQKVRNKLFQVDTYQYTLFDGPVKFASHYSQPKVTRLANGGIEVMVSGDDVDDSGKTNWEEITIIFEPEDLKELAIFL